MNKIKIVDLNRSLIQACNEAGLDAEWSDYFYTAANTPNAVLMTASNPMWTFGGGIDAKFANIYPDLIEEKQTKGGGMERIENIVFAITVDENYHATPEVVKKAIEFALSALKENETLLLHGAGTGIGGLSIEDFVEIIKGVSTPHKTN